MVQPQPQAEEPQLHQQQPESSLTSAGKWRRKVLLAFAVAGLFWLFWFSNENSILRRKRKLASLCHESARLLEDQFSMSMNHVHALAVFVSTFYHGKEPPALDQRSFEEYAEKTAFERPLTSGVAYALRVLHPMRDQFEKQQGWKIKKLMESEDETLDSSTVKTEYAPVIFTEKTLSHIVSIDVMSGKEDRENILRARATGKTVLTSPFKLLKSQHSAVVLTFAVYNTDLPPNATPEQRIDATIGYLGALYDVTSSIQKLLHKLASKETIAVNVYDTTNNSAPIMMYGDDSYDTGLQQITYLDFGDPMRKHEIHCRFKNNAGSTLDSTDSIYWSPCNHLLCPQ